MKEENILKGATMVLFGVWIFTAFAWQQQTKISEDLNNDNKYLRSEIEKRDCVNIANAAIVSQYEQFIESAKNPRK